MLLSNYVKFLIELFFDYLSSVKADIFGEKFAFYDDDHDDDFVSTESTEFLRRISHEMDDFGGRE